MQLPVVPRQAREHWRPIEAPVLEPMLLLLLMAVPLSQLHCWAPEQAPSLELSLLLYSSGLLPQPHHSLKEEPAPWVPKQAWLPEPWRSLRPWAGSSSV